MTTRSPNQLDEPRIDLARAIYELKELHGPRLTAHWLYQAATKFLLQRFGLKAIAVREQPDTKLQCGKTIVLRTSLISIASLAGTQIQKSKI
jgi:hypothetical protein